jgi:general secretion pathway protein F
MIAVGEETGRLDDMLLKVADNYDKSVRNMIKRFVNLLEPAMILDHGIDGGIYRNIHAHGGIFHE